jgi:hypothetical protein
MSIELLARKTGIDYRLLSRRRTVVGATGEETSPAPHPTGRNGTSQEPQTNGNHSYECLYDILRSDTPETEKPLALQRYKFKIVRLHGTRRSTTLLDLNDHDKLDGEEPSLFHVLKLFRRREGRRSDKYRTYLALLTPDPRTLPTFLWHTCVRNTVQSTRTRNP